MAVDFTATALSRSSPSSARPTSDLSRRTGQTTSDDDAADGPFEWFRAKGFRDYETLKGPERHRFGAYAYGLFRSYENLFYQHAQGTIESHLWEGFRNMLLRDLRNPGLVAWWDSQRNIFSPEFQRHIDELRN